MYFRQQKIFSLYFAVEKSERGDQIFTLQLESSPLELHLEPGPEARFIAIYQRKTDQSL
jgi:hypothetical protein